MLVTLESGAWLEKVELCRWRRKKQGWQGAGVKVRDERLGLTHLKLKVRGKRLGLTHLEMTMSMELRVRDRLTYLQGDRAWGQKSEV